MPLYLYFSWSIGSSQSEVPDYIESDRLVAAIDKCDYFDNQVVAHGWVVLKGSERYKQKIYSIDTDNNARLLKYKSTKRNDVAGYFHGNRPNNFFGFNAYARKSNLRYILITATTGDDVYGKLYECK